MSTILSQTAERIGLTTYELFREICGSSDVTAGRLDMFWSAYLTEDFVPEFIEAACFKIMLGTTNKEGAD